MKIALFFTRRSSKIKPKRRVFTLKQVLLGITLTTAAIVVYIGLLIRKIFF